MAVGLRNHGNHAYNYHVLELWEMQAMASRNTAILKPSQDSCSGLLILRLVIVDLFHSYVAPRFGGLVTE